MLHEEGRDFPTWPAQGDYAVVIALALKKCVGASRHASKTLMRWTGASERTAKNWLAASNGPSGRHLIQLARHSPEVRQAIEVLVGYRCVGGSDDVQRARELISAGLKLLDGHPRQ